MEKKKMNKRDEEKKKKREMSMRVTELSGVSLYIYD